MKELARLCGRLLLRGAAWATYTLVLAVIAGVAVRTWNCWDSSCPPLTAPLEVAVWVAAFLAIIGAFAMLWAAALTRRWLALRPGDWRWLVTGAAYTMLTLPLVTAVTVMTLAIVAALTDAARAVRVSNVWRMDARVSEVESDVRALMLAVGAQDGPTYRFPEWDAAASRACAPAVSPDNTRGGGVLPVGRMPH